MYIGKEKYFRCRRCNKFEKISFVNNYKGNCYCDDCYEKITGI